MPDRCPRLSASCVCERARSCTVFDLIVTHLVTQHFVPNSARSRLKPSLLMLAARRRRTYAAEVQRKYTASDAVRPAGEIIVGQLVR